MTNAAARPPLISTAQVSTQTGLSKSTIYRRCKKGLFPAPKYIGQKKFWQQDIINAWLDANLNDEPSFNNVIPKEVAHDQPAN